MIDQSPQQLDQARKKPVLQLVKKQLGDAEVSVMLEDVDDAWRSALLLRT